MEQVKEIYDREKDLPGHTHYITINADGTWSYSTRIFLGMKQDLIPRIGNLSWDEACQIVNSRMAIGFWNLWDQERYERENS